MYCPNCGSENQGGSGLCKDCGRSLPRAESFESAPSGESAAPAPPVHVPNYLVQAILVTVFCCLPFGIVSLVFAAQVNGKVASGDIEGAQRTSEDARKWAWVAFWVGLAIAIAVALFYVVLFIFLLAVGETTEVFEWL
jgi:ABC-type Fe3+ transport system permease subunit